MINEDKEIVRYTANQRLNHWLIALSFVLLAISGLALFHPAMFWLSNLLGEALGHEYCIPLLAW